MQHDRALKSQVLATVRSKVSNGTRLLQNVDGRCAMARRFRDICRSYETEAGGDLSEVNRDLLRQAAGLTLRAEQLQSAMVRGEAVDTDQLIRLSSTAKRILGGLSDKARKRTEVAGAGPSTLQEHIARRAAVQPMAATG
jgi:hypothetical protein